MNDRAPTVDLEQAATTHVAPEATPASAPSPSGMFAAAMGSFGPGLLQRKLSRRIARRAGGTGDGAPGDGGAALERAASDGGGPVDPGVARSFEGATGASVEGVRVHTGAASAAAAESVGARAYTVGQDVHFGEGQYRPGTPDGDHLISHELAHTVQQGSGGGGAPQAQLEVSQPDDPAEAEADRVADAVTSGQSAPRPALPAGGAMRSVARSIQRDPTPTGATPHGAGTTPPGPGATPGTGTTPPAGATPAPGAPAGADGAAALSPAEQAQKAAFRLRNMHLANNIPSTGIGKFDASYFPALGLMPVTVKLHFDFVQADNTPGFLDRLRRSARGQSNAQFFWTDAEKDSYKRDFVSRVAARWTAQHTMHATKPGWTEFLAVPFVTPTPVEDKASAHFAVTVHKSSGPGIDYKSGVNNEHLGNPSAQPTADFWQSDNTEASDFNSSQVATTERTRIEGVLASSSASPVQFAVGSADVPAAARASLGAFATGLNQANPSAPMVPIDIEGYASPEGDAARNQALSDQRAQNVASALRGLGVRQPVRPSGKGPTGAPNDVAGRKAEIKVDHAFETTYSSNRYSVSEHEFGHMLGNPDEYSNAAPATPLGGVQTRYSGLVTSAGLSVPTFGEDTSSQMSNGVDVLPRHYVTLWEALGRMTQPDITQNQWSLT